MGLLFVVVVVLVVTARDDASVVVVVVVMTAVRWAILANMVILASSIKVTLNKLLGFVVQLDSVVDIAVHTFPVVMEAPPRRVAAAVAVIQACCCCCIAVVERPVVRVDVVGYHNCRRG